MNSAWVLREDFVRNDEELETVVDRKGKVRHFVAGDHDPEALIRLPEDGLQRRAELMHRPVPVQRRTLRDERDAEDHAVRRHVRPLRSVFFRLQLSGRRAIDASRRNWTRPERVAGGWRGTGAAPTMGPSEPS